MAVSEAIADVFNTVIDTVGSLVLSPNQEDMLDIESIETDNILVGKGGVLLSSFRIFGYHGHVDTDAFEALCLAFKGAISPFLTKADNFWIKCQYESDGELAETELSDNLNGLISSAALMNIDNEKLVKEKIAANLPHVQSERVILSFYYRSEKKDRSEVKYDPTPIPTGSSLLLSNSGNFVYRFESILSHMHELLRGFYDVEWLSSYEQLRLIYGAINGSKLGLDWEPNVLNMEQAIAYVYKKYENLESPKKNFVRRFFMRDVNGRNDKSLEPLLPRRLDEQLLPFKVTSIGDSRVMVNNRAYEAVAIESYMSSPMGFNYLLKSMKGIPFRMAFLVSGNGMDIAVLESLLAVMLNWLPENKNRKLARDRLESAAKHSSMVKMSICACVWSDAPEKISDVGEVVRDLKELNYRAEKLKLSINGWGGCTSTSHVTTPISAFFATLPVASFRHQSMTASLPIEECISLMPICRPTSLWRRGGFVMRSDDGKIVPMSIRSSEQSTDIRAITGEPGKGKSSLIFCSHYSYFFEPSGSGEMPILRCIDFGYSLKGLFELIKDGLPEGEKHRSIYEKIENSSRYTRNIFDLPLGQRTPLPFQLSFLVNFLTLACYTLSGNAGLQGLCTTVVKKAYAYYTDANGNSNSKRYILGQDNFIDRALRQLKVEAEPGQTPWFEIMDEFAKRREFRLAARAQRYAVPTLQNLATIVQLPEIRAEYKELHHGVEVTKLFARSITETGELLPMVAGVTVFDVSDSNAVGLDLKEVIGSAEASNEAVTRQSTLIYLAVMQMLTADFYTDEDELGLYNSDYYDFHKSRIGRIARSKRCVSFDELHRLEAIPSAFREADRFAYEGRKFGISVVAASQRPSSLPAGIRTLASTTFMCGGEMASLNLVQEQFQISEEVKLKISALPKPDKGGNYMYAYFRGSRSFGCFLRNTEGPTMLAAMATSMEDRTVLRELANVFGTYAKACEIFGEFYPGGTCAHDISVRTQLVSKNRDDNPGRGNPARPNPIDNIIYDICKSRGKDYVNNSSAVG